MFNDVLLDNSDQVKIKPPKGFGASDAVGKVVEIISNNRFGESFIYLEMFNKREAAEVKTKKTVKNFLKYVENGFYDNSLMHRSVPGFVLQGGGFSAPLMPASEGGTVEPIDFFDEIKNEPGNSNLRGTIAMARQPGSPDSATNQWFFNLSDENQFLDFQDEGFTVFGAVLGDGMAVVDQLSSAQVYDFGGVFSELPLWELNEDGASSLDIQPQDFVVLKSVRELKAKNHPYNLSVESSDDDLVKVSVGRNQKIKLNASDSLTGNAQVSVSAVSLIDGAVYEDSFDVVVGSAGSSQSNKKRIDVFVDAGSFEQPHYRFFDANGEEFDSFEINVKKKYRFHRLDQAESHPFYIGDLGYNQASTDSVKIKGDGSFVDGITGSEMLEFHVRKSDRKAFKRDGELSFFCTSHPSMIGTFSIKGQKSPPVIETVQEMSSEPVIDEPVVGYQGQGGYYRMITDSLDQLPLI